MRGCRPMKDLRICEWNRGAVLSFPSSRSLSLVLSSPLSPSLLVSLHEFPFPCFSSAHVPFVALPPWGVGKEAVGDSPTLSFLTPSPEPLQPHFPSIRLLFRKRHLGVLSLSGSLPLTLELLTKSMTPSQILKSPTQKLHSFHSFQPSIYPSALHIFTHIVTHRVSL